MLCNMLLFPKAKFPDLGTAIVGTGPPDAVEKCLNCRSLQLVRENDSSGTSWKTPTEELVVSLVNLVNVGRWVGNCL